MDRHTPTKRFACAIVLLLLFVSVATGQRGYDRPRPGVTVYAVQDSISIAGQSEQVSKQRIPIYDWDTFAIFAKYDTTTGTGIDVRTFIEISADGKTFTPFLVDDVNMTEDANTTFKSVATIVPHTALWGRCRIINDAGSGVATSVRVSWVIGYRSR